MATHRQGRPLKGGLERRQQGEADITALNTNTPTQQQQQQQQQQ